MVIFIGISLFLVFVPIYAYTSYARAKYRAFRTGALRVPFCGGLAELVLWEPGQTVILLKHKRLVPMTDPEGGYRVISALRAEEYKGRISCKTQFMSWTSDPILTSDGLSVHFVLGIWWRIKEPKLYIERVSSDYHAGEKHFDEGVAEAAEFWIKRLAGGTLREHIIELCKRNANSKMQETARSPADSRYSPFHYLCEAQ